MKPSDAAPRSEAYTLTSAAHRGVVHLTAAAEASAVRRSLGERRKATRYTDHHDDDHPSHVSRGSRHGLGADDRAAPRARRTGLRAAERHDPARPGGMRHAGAAPGEHRASWRGPISSSSRWSTPTPTARTTWTGGRGATATRFARSSTTRPGAAATPASAPGRDVARQIMETYYRKHESPQPRHPVVRGLPRDAREGDRHPGRREHHARSPARRASTSRRSGRARPPSRTSPSRACSTRCAARSRLRAPAPAPSHLLAYSNNPDRHTLAAWISGRRDRTGPRGPQLDQPSVLAAGDAGVPRVRPARATRVQLGAVAGPGTRSPVSPRLHLRGVSRLVRVRHRLPRRHGPLQPVAAVPHPAARRARVRRSASEQRGVRG